MFGGTVASAVDATLDRIKFPATTTTVSGTDQIQTATGFNYIVVNRPTYTDASAVVVDRGATVYIEGAPIAAGSLTLTDPYALWVDGGLNRFDGDGTHVFELPGTDVDPTGGGGAATGYVAIRIAGATRKFAYYS
jgi:hypothetical protein